MIAIDELKFDDQGLIPAIVQDFENGRVLTLAYMNRESLEISLEKRLTCFWSRSRRELARFRRRQIGFRDMSIRYGPASDPS